VTHLCLVDPAIATWHGHYGEYARAIADQARREGKGFSVLARRTVASDVIQALNAEPVFRHDFWRRFVYHRKPGFLVNPPLLNWAFGRDLHRSLSGRDLSDWLLFMPTLDHHQMLGWAWWLRQTPAAKRPRVVLLFRYSYCIQSPTRLTKDSWWARLGFWALSRFVATGQVRLATDSQRLARQYQRLTSWPLEVVPIPHTSDTQPSPATTVERRRPRLRLVTLGDARDEKGFGLVARAMQYLCLHASPVLEQHEFVLQGYISHPSHALMRGAQQWLQNLARPNIQLVDQSLVRDDYARFLQSADVVLLPYARRIYYARTSGPFTEALAAGKVVVVTQDTWMSDQLAEHGGGLTTPDGDAVGLANTILAVCEQYEALAAQARKRQPAWVAFHNPANLMRQLVTPHLADAERGCR